MPTSCRLGAALPWLLFAAAASAGEAMPSLEDLFSAEVEGASRYAQPLAEAPAAVTVITAEDIARYGHETLVDALTMARGVYATYDYAYTQLGVRGFNRPGDYNSRILLLVDGARYNDNAYDQASVGTDAPVDPTWIKRVEFVPGPASALYGGNALFGVANVILWSGADLEGTRVRVAAGSQGRQSVSLLSGHNQDGRDWVGGITFSRGNGSNVAFPEFAVPGVSDGVARALDGESLIKGFARFSGGGWRITGSFAERGKDIPTAYYGTSFGVPGDTTRDRNIHLDITHASPLDQAWTQFARIHLGWFDYRGNYVYPGLTNRDDASGSWWSGEYRLGYGGLAGHQVEVGGELRRNVSIHQRYRDISPPADYLDDRRSNESLGLYIHDEWRLSRQWIANLGYRVDQVDDFTAFGSPRLALIYRPAPELSLRLLHGTAFRAPNAYERFYQDGNQTQKANPALKPEWIETNEISGDWSITPVARVGLGFYRNRIHDLIDTVVDPLDGLQVFTNRPSLVAEGTEMEAESYLGSGWRLRGSVTWQKVLADGGEPANSPRRLGKLFADGPLFGSGWTAGLGLQAVSARRAVLGNVPGHLAGNLTLRQERQGPYGRWSIDWRNVGNTRYSEPASLEHVQVSLPQPGRQWLLRWEYAL